MSKKKRGEDYMKEEDEILRKVGTAQLLSGASLFTGICQ